MSGHPNHIAVYDGVLLVSCSAPSVEFLQLDSTSLLRKYIGVLDILLSFLLGTFVILNLKFWVLYVAMKQHKSQFVWYRRLFILFSRYSFVNTFTVMGEKVHK